MLNIVISMAGRGSRFTKAGYKVPKFMIPAKGKTLFDWSLLSLASFIPLQAKWVFIALKEHHARDFIVEHCKALGISEPQIIEIDQVTSGQAETVYLATKDLPAEDAIAIYNIDTYVNPEHIRPEQISGDGCLPCFKAPGDHWSFARTDEKGNVVEVAEKKRVSDNCTIGLYYFRTAKMYNDLYEKYYANAATESLQAGERYVAPLYNYMIQEGKRVTIFNIPFEEVHVLGTPEELHAWLDS